MLTALLEKAFTEQDQRNCSVLLRRGIEINAGQKKEENLLKAARDQRAVTGLPSVIQSYSVIGPDTECYRLDERKNIQRDSIQDPREGMKFDVTNN